jgi:surface antigen
VMYRLGSGGHVRAMKNASRFGGVLVCLGLAVLALASSASASLGPSIGTLVDASDTQLHVRLDVNADSRAVCRAEVLAHHASLRLPALRLGSTGAAQWSWSVPAAAPRGFWVARVTCKTGGTTASTSRRFEVATRSRRHEHSLIVAKTLRLQQLAPSSSKGGFGAAGNPYEFPECTWYAWSRRTDLPRFAGNALSWAADARADGIPTGTMPVAGAIAVFQPGQDGAFPPYGHVAYVESVSGGAMTISEMNWGSTYAERSHVHYRTLAWAGVAFIYGGPARNGPGSPTPAPPSTVPAPSQPAGTFVHHVYHTCANGACGLRVHTAPSLSSPVVAIKNDGDEVYVTCQTEGDRVYGLNGSSSTVWDRLADGTYVGDYYVDTPSTTGGFSPPIPQCATSPAPPPTPPPAPPTPTPQPPQVYIHHVYGTCADGACGLQERTGAGYSSYPSVGALSEGAELRIVCQTTGQLVTPNHGTASDVWDRLEDGDYVTDVYVDTPGVGGGFSPPIPQC